IEKEGFDLRDLKHCLITHAHLDHYGACHKLKAFNKDIKFYAHELDAEKIENIPTDQYIAEAFPNYKYTPVKLDKKIKKDNEILKFGQLKFNCIHIPGHTPGSLAFLLETKEKRILFGGDLPGIAINRRDGNLKDYLKSMQKLLRYNIDILCEGHENLIQPAEKVKKFIEGYMKFNDNLNLVALENPSDVKALLEITKINYELEFFDTALDFCNYLLEISPNNVEALKLHEKIKKHNPNKMDFIKSLIKEKFPQFLDHLQEKPSK
ncbi:MAG: MBL fold metallo-hydrolase, partial [Candidatus Hodarchaeota archaeon]